MQIFSKLVSYLRERKYVQPVEFTCGFSVPKGVKR